MYDAFYQKYSWEKLLDNFLKMHLKEDLTKFWNSKQIKTRISNFFGKYLVWLFKIIIRIFKEYQQLCHAIKVNKSDEEKGFYYIPNLGLYTEIGKKSKPTPFSFSMSWTDIIAQKTACFTREGALFKLI